MATIEKRTDSTGAITYRAKVRLRGYPQESASFKRKTDAKNWSANTESALREGRYFKTGESKYRTLTDAIKRYRSELLPKLKDPQHRLHHLAWWEEQIGHTILADLRRSKVVECLTNLKNTPSTYGKHNGNQRTDATVNRYLASLSPVLTAAVKQWDWLEDNPCKKVIRGTESRGRVRFLDNEERTALLNACEEMTEVPEIKIIVLVAITTGARKGEIMGLHWRHVDLQERRLIFEGTKNGETRAAPLVGPALQVIKEWSKVRPLNSDELVFPGRGQRTSEKPLDIDKVWKEVINKSGINDFRFHDLRHTAASYLAMNGVGLREISDILGHKTLAMVQRYAHLCEDHKRNTMERVAIAVFGDLG